jgi:hypothetical protein
VEKTGHFNFTDCYFNFLFSVEAHHYGEGSVAATTSGRPGPKATPQANSKA